MGNTSCHCRLHATSCHCYFDLRQRCFAYLSWRGSLVCCCRCCLRSCCWRVYYPEWENCGFGTSPRFPARLSASDLQLRPCNVEPKTLAGFDDFQYSHRFGLTYLPAMDDFSRSGHLYCRLEEGSLAFLRRVKIFHRTCSILAACLKMIVAGDWLTRGQKIDGIIVSTVHVIGLTHRVHPLRNLTQLCQRNRKYSR